MSALNAVVEALDDSLVLVDVGASGGTPAIWRDFAKHATYLGFDPDAREIRETAGGEFARAVYINKAVAGAEAGGTVRFFLTRSPYCSSTLRPNSLVTESFLSAEKFIVEGETTAPATTVADALHSLGLSHVDWLKVDTQGTDLRIFSSLPDPLRQELLAADLEPGLRGAYMNEELFSDVHGVMLREGFWLSRMEVLGFPRMRKATLDLLSHGNNLREQSVTKGVRRTPGWVECRYLRTLESLAERSAPRRDYLVLWAFAYVDQQFGYCLDVAADAARRFQNDALAMAMTQDPLARSAEACARRDRADAPTLRARIKRKLRSLLSYVRVTQPTAPQPVHSPELLVDLRPA